MENKYYYEICLGIKDKNKNHKIALNQVQKNIEKAFSKYLINFSLSIQKGGYVHEDGSYVLEDSLKIVYIGDYEEETVLSVIDDLKRIYDQESVLLIKKRIEQEYVGEM